MTVSTRLVALLVSISWTLAIYAAEAADGAARAIWDGIYTVEQAKRGRQLADVQCAMCHGHDLFGTPGAPAMAGPMLLFVWNGRTIGELIEFIRVTMPPGRTGMLGDQELGELLATMLQRSGFPAWKQRETPPNIEEIENILITREQPE